jgi:DNA processing protein
VLLEVGCADAAAKAVAAREAAGRALATAHAKRIDHVRWSGANYPPLLAAIFDPPLVLWVRGAIDLLAEPAVAIVGSRAASAYGEETAARLASDLAARGLVIVSGLARGIDAAAHRGALAAAGGRTVAVLGCGPDVAYPPEHAALLEEVVRRGAVVSEFPPGTRPLSYHFPRRNRIISGLSLGVVVVEARQRSGALITADCALEQGRDVCAVPGNVLSERHRGSHTLLKSGAALVETADDVLQAVGLVRREAAASGRERARDPLLALMDTGDSYALDALAASSGCDVAVLLPRLLELELQGFVRRVPGGRFVRSAANVLT